MKIGSTLKHEGETGYNACQQLLVRSWRLIMAQGVDCPLVQREFTCACGANGGQAFQSFCIFLWALARSQRRRLLVNPPGSRSLTADEIRMLTVIAASQHDCPALLQTHLSWLAQRTLRNTLEQSTHELVGHLNSSRLQLPAPPDPAAEPARPRCSEDTALTQVGLLLHAFNRRGRERIPGNGFRS